VTRVEPSADESQERAAQVAEERRGADQPKVDRDDEGQLDDIMAASRDRYAARWIEIQASFVDEPRRAVDEADRLLTELIDFMADQRERLSRNLSETEADTESLRLGLQRYRQLLGSLMT